MAEGMDDKKQPAPTEKPKRVRKKENPQKRGAKPKRPVSDEDFAIFENLCKIQCTLHEIAAFFDVDVNTIESHVKAHYGKNFSEVFKEKRKLGHVSLRRKQYEKALEGNTTMLIWLGKQYLKQLDKIETSGGGDEREKNTLSSDELERRINKRLERRNGRTERAGATAG